MAKKLTRNEFIRRAKKIHGDKYDYSKSIIVGYNFKTTIICKKHGKFEQRVGNHLNGKGCAKCKGGVLLNRNVFITRAKKVHDNRYTYDSVVYKGMFTKVVIICPVHGKFEQTPHSHLQGCGCSKCAGKNKSCEDFIKEADKIHLYKYKYINNSYTNLSTDMSIICSKHGVFIQKPRQHLLGQGCPKCANNYRLNTDTFIQKLINIHGNIFNMSKVNYINSKYKVLLTCSKHGDFFISPDMVLQGHGCPKCSLEKIRLTTEEFILKAIEKHCWKYNYAKVDYFNSRTKVIIICPKHGEFKQQPSVHLQGAGCPKCSNIGVSKLEKELLAFIKNNYFGEVVENDRTVLEGKEVDIYLPDLKVAVEFNGLYWHTEEYVDRHYHKEKTSLALNNGIHLIHIWEDDWVYHKNRTKSWLLAILNLNSNTKVYARQTTYVEIDKKVAYFLFDKYHIQGSVSCSVCVGLKYNNKFIAICGFTKIDNNIYNLVRYIVLPEFNILAGFKKIISNFQKQYNCAIVTFADLTWVNPYDNVYTRNGFNEEKILDTDYKYLYNNKRKHKFGFRHKYLKNKLIDYDPTKTEHENCLNNDVYRIYDCGKIKYKFTYVR